MVFDLFTQFIVHFLIFVFNDRLYWPSVHRSLFLLSRFLPWFLWSLTLWTLKLGVQNGRWRTSTTTVGWRWIGHHRYRESYDPMSDWSWNYVCIYLYYHHIIYIYIWFGDVIQFCWAEHLAWQHNSPWVTDWDSTGISCTIPKINMQPENDIRWEILFKQIPSCQVPFFRFPPLNFEVFPMRSHLIDSSLNLLWLKRNWTKVTLAARTYADEKNQQIHPRPMIESHREVVAVDHSRSMAEPFWNGVSSHDEHFTEESVLWGSQLFHRALKSIFGG